jgi:cephalosporin-C deacetylase
MLSDLPLPELRAYVPEVAEPADFAAFWAVQVASARAVRSAASFDVVDGPVRHAAVFDVTFSGYDGDPIKGWLLLPRQAGPSLPVIVEYIGYGGGRGDPFDWLKWSCAGYPHLVVDSRGQGGRWRSADTADPGDSGAPSTPGFMTKGIASPQTHYYTRLFTDAARAIDVVGEHPALAGRPVVAAGGSQGGGLAIAAAHLTGAAAAVLPDVPFLAHPRRAVDLTDADPYGELAAYCRVHPAEVDQVFDTLSYIDVVNHAKRTTAPALFSVGLTDIITPPSTIFAAYNHYAGPKEISVYQFSGHEGGGTPHFLAQLAFLRDRGLGEAVRPDFGPAGLTA